MSTLKSAFELWENLAPPWHEYFRTNFGIDQIDTPDAFRSAMDQPRNNCLRAPGFADFAADTAKGVEPGNPAASFLYHALASPAVQPEGLDDSAFPTEEQLDVFEDYVFAAARLTIADIAQRAAGQPLAIAVFTKQYRNAIDTTHGRHADLVFSRTGVARVGNEGKRWNGRRRCYDSCVKGREGMPVLPSSYSAWIAVQSSGDSSKSLPGRFQTGDDSQSFWVPLHKLFDGQDCVSNVSVRLSFSHGHRNEKLRRIHRALQWLGQGSQHSEPEISAPPFVETSLLEAFTTHADSCIVVPTARIAEEAGSGAASVRMFVPPNFQPEDSSLHLMPRPRRWAPEFVYVRDAIVDGQRRDLIEEFDVSEFVRHGGFEAVHYRDFTGDGWIRVDCASLAMAIPVTLPAYSILAPPDLVPNVRQSDLMDWYSKSAPSDVKPNLWVGSSPVPLCDVREAANITLPRSGFLITDVTVSALVGLSGQGAGDSAASRAPSSDAFRTTSLPDDSSGIFAPGSEIGDDQTELVAQQDGSTGQPSPFFSNYGMGSPFLEDTKLCAAQSAFWPGTTPDTSRVYEPRSQPSVTPLTDEEIGWDGSPLPEEIPGKQLVRHRSRAHTDYIRHTNFNFGLLADLTLDEYLERTLTMSRVYQTLGAATLYDRSRWVLLRFHPTPGESGGWDGLTLPGSFGRGYCLRMYRYTGMMPDRAEGQRLTTFLVGFDETIRAVANPRQVLLNRNGFWEHFQF